MKEHTRLTAWFALLLFVGLLLFAAAAVWILDRNLRESLDTRLATAARASVAFLDVKHGRIILDADDREQFLSIMGVDVGGAVLDETAHVLLSSAAREPGGIIALGNGHSRFATVGQGQASARAFAFPIVRDGKRLGTVVVWRGSDWIDETDRNVAIAFLASALLIAALALAAGNAVARRALADAFARQRRFTADASHELRAPLAVIRAEADLALSRTRDAQTYRAAIETIAAEADRIEALISDLLSAARAESGSLSKEDVDVAAIAQAVCERLMPLARTKHAHIACVASGSAVVRGDRGALERAILSIAHNAVTHVGEGGNVLLSTRRADGLVEVTIQDDGGGFSPEALRFGFERFWRDEGRGSHAGTGLGLAIAKSIVEALSGSIALGNNAAGAQVKIHLPAIHR